MQVRVPLTGTHDPQKAFKCQYKRNPSDIFSSDGLTILVAADNSSATCSSTHLTDFAVHEYEPAEQQLTANETSTTAPPVEDSTGQAEKSYAVWMPVIYLLAMVAASLWSVQ